MKYNDKELEQAREAHEDARDLDNLLNAGKRKENGDTAETVVWLLNLFVAFLYVLFFQYGSASDMSLTEVLVGGGMLFSPAILYSTIRRSRRAIIEHIISRKRAKATLYVDYTNESMRVKKAYTNAIDKVIAMAKSNDRIYQKKLEQMGQEFDKEVERSGLPAHEIEYAEQLGMEYAQRQLKNLTETEKKKFEKIISKFSVEQR